MAVTADCIQLQLVAGSALQEVTQREQEESSHDESRGGNGTRKQPLLTG